MGYAFISYSTKNQATADAIRNTFTANKIDTWMAPYSIPPGSKYAQSITNAIRNCSCFVLLLSNASQESEAVDSEVELAALTFKKSIVTIQIENVVLNDAFTFYIHNKQILPLDRVDVSSPAMKTILSTVISFAGQTLTSRPQSPQQPTYTQTASHNPSASSSTYTSGNAQADNRPYGYTNQATRNNAVQSPKRRIVAAILAIFLGNLGIHHFYLRKHILGILCIVFCWTYIPSVLSLIDGIILLCTSNQKFDEKYNR